MQNIISRLSSLGKTQRILKTTTLALIQIFICSKYVNRPINAFKIDVQSLKLSILYLGRSATLRRTQRTLNTTTPTSTTTCIWMQPTSNKKPSPFTNRQYNTLYFSSSVCPSLSHSLSHQVSHCATIFSSPWKQAT